MMRLFLRPQSPARREADVATIDAIAWVVLDDGAIRSQGSGDSSGLADLASNSAFAEPSNVVLIVPAESCLSVQCSIPARSIAQARRALPFAVEEHLASDLDEMHIAAGAIRRDAPIDVVAIEHDLLRGWLDALSQAGFTPGYAVADASLLEAGADSIAVLFDEHRVLVKTPHQWLAAGIYALPSALAAAVGEGPSEVPLKIRAINGSIPPIARADLEQRAGRPIEWEEEETDAPTLVHLARAFAPARISVDLLSGPYARAREHSAVWTKWRAAAALAGVWIVVALLATGARGLWAAHRANVLEAQAVALYKEFFPHDRRIQDVKAQMAAHLHLGRDSTSSSSVLSLIGDISQVVTPESGAEVRSLAFSGERAELNTEIALPGFDRLDRIKTNLEHLGLTVEITSAEQQDHGIIARLRVRGVS